MNSIIEFKVPSLEPQFEQIDSRLRIVLYALIGFIWTKFRKTVIITDLLRTQEEQDNIYKDDLMYKLKAFQSVHQFGRGVDISIKFYTNDEVAQIHTFLNKNFGYSNSHKTAVLHDIGLGIHIHIQVNDDNITDIVRQ